MKLNVDTIPPKRRCDVVVLIGDGPTDLRVLREIARRVHGDKILCYPGGGRSTGLPGIAKALAILLQAGSKVSNYMVVLDLEHFRGEPEEELRAILSRHGIECQRLESNVLECVHGNRELKVYLAVLGSQECRSIEWNMAELIRIERGASVGCDKEEIRRWPRKRGTDDKSLIRNAKYENLRRAFSVLVETLEHLSEDPDQPTPHTVP